MSFLCKITPKYISAGHFLKLFNKEFNLLEKSLLVIIQNIVRFLRELILSCMVYGIHISDNFCNFVYFSSRYTLFVYVMFT